MSIEYLSRQKLYEYFSQQEQTAMEAFNKAEDNAKMDLWSVRLSERSMAKFTIADFPAEKVKPIDTLKNPELLKMNEYNGYECSKCKESFNIVNPKFCPYCGTKFGKTMDYETYKFVNKAMKEMGFWK